MFKKKFIKKKYILLINEIKRIKYFLSGLHFNLKIILWIEKHVILVELYVDFYFGLSLKNKNISKQNFAEIDNLII